MMQHTKRGAAIAIDSVGEIRNWLAMSSQGSHNTYQRIPTKLLATMQVLVAISFDKNTWGLLLW
jgi:hypothetical protein